MATLPPALHDSRIAGSGSGVDASELRYLIAALEGNKSCVVGANDLLVTERALGANMSVDIAPATLPAFIKATTGTRNGVYDLKTDAALINLVVGASHATLPRVDAVVIQANDAYDLSRAGVAPTPLVVPGVATAGATLANLLNAPGTPADSILLAYVLVPAASAAVVNANIKDARTLLGASAATTGVIDRQTGVVDVVNTAAETTLYSYAIAAGLLGTNKGLRLRMICDHLNNTGSAAGYIVRVKLGATTIFQDATIGYTSDAKRRDVLVDLSLFNQGSANDQIMQGLWAIGAIVNAATAGRGDLSATPSPGENNAIPIGGDGAVDTSAAQTLAVTIQFITASVNNSLRRQLATLELI